MGKKAVLALLRVVACLPLPALYAVSTVLYWLLFRIGRYRTRLIVNHIERAFPALGPREVARLARRHQRSVAEIAVEILKAFNIRPRDLAARVAIENLDRLKLELTAGRPVLVLAAHHCNWEWLLQSMALQLAHPIEAVYKPLHQAAAEEATRWMRARFGVRPIPAKTVLADLLKRPRAPRVIAMVADQVPTNSAKRAWLRFLGQETAFYTGPELIARTMRIPVFLALMERMDRGRYRARVELLGDRRLALGDLTLQYARRLEQHLREHPAEWLWGHRRWKIRRALYEPLLLPPGESEHQVAPPLKS